MKGAFVDENKCIGCRLCTHLCADVFEMQSGGKAFAVHPFKGDKESVESCIAACPAHAISWKKYE